LGTFASTVPGDSLGTAKLVVLPLIPTGATQTFTGWFTVGSSTSLITAGSLPDQLIQIPWGEIMNKGIYTGIGAIVLIGGLAACGANTPAASTPASNTPAVSTPAVAPTALTWSAAKIVSEVTAACIPSSASPISDFAVAGTPSDNGSTETASLQYKL
jgi:hypothetical protein